MHPLFPQEEFQDPFYDDKKYQIFDVNVINYPKGYDDWLEQKNKELEKQIQQQLLKEQEKEDIQTTIAIDSIAKDIRIEPYSRKPEDIEAMKGFVAKVSGETIENITNQQAQAFIDNLGTTEEAYLTVKKDGTFEYTNNNPYSPEIYKTSEPKEILSILEDYANDHLTGHEQESEQEKDYEFIHSVNERFNEINKEYLIKNTSDKAEELRNALQEKDKELNIWIAKAEADNKEISRLNDQLEAANKIIQEQNQLLEGKGSVKVNGVERTFEHGLKQAFPEAVKRIDIENQRNKDLTADYNELLKSQSQNIAPVSPTDYDTRSD